MQHDKKSNQCQNKCTINNKNSFSHKIMIKEQFTVCSKSKSVQFVCACLPVYCNRKKTQNIDEECYKESE